VGNVQLAHRTVIDFWDKMSEWFKSNQNLIGTLGQVTQRARAWRDTTDPAEKDKYLIGPTAELNDAMDLFWAFRKREDRLSTDTRAFIRASTLASNFDGKRGVTGLKQSWLWTLAAAGEGEWLEQLLDRLKKVDRSIAKTALAARDPYYTSTALL